MGLVLSLDERTPLVDGCKGCLRAGADGFCTTYLFPETKFRNGLTCPGYIQAISRSNGNGKRKGRAVKATTFAVSKYRRDVLTGKRPKKGKGKRR